MKKKSILILIFVSILLFTSCYLLATKVVMPKLRGDSGFDTSYDSGGSWDSDSSSSYDSGSSYDYGSSNDYSYDSYSSGSSGGGSSYRGDYSMSSSSYDTTSAIIGLIVTGVIFLIFIIFLISKNGIIGFFKIVLQLIYELITMAILFAVYILIMYLIYKKIGLFALPASPFVFFAYVIIIISFLSVFKRKNKNKLVLNKKIEKTLNKNFSISGIILPKLISDYNVDKFLADRYNDYLDIQNAWMNFDYDKLKEKLTDELYNQYVMQLDTMKVKNERNVMSNFDFKDSMLVYEKSENGSVYITMELIVGFYDYIEKNGKVIRGTKSKKVMQHYEMVFVMDSSKDIKCPRCGHDISGIKDNMCPSCHSNIMLQNNDWKLCKKRSVEQGYE